MPLSFTQEVEKEYLALSGDRVPLPSRQARAIIKVMSEHIERQDNHIRSIENRLLALQNTDYFVKRYLLAGREEPIVIDSEKENG